MKTVNLKQTLNPEYFGYSTPDIDRNLYLVTKVTNSLFPLIGDCLLKVEADEYCKSDDWNVNIT